MTNSAITNDTEGTIYFGGGFTNSPTAVYIAEWNSSAWNSSAWDSANYERVSIVDRCGYCGAGVQVVDACPRCGAPPVRKREYERGKFLVTFYESLWARAAKRIGRLLRRSE